MPLAPARCGLAALLTACLLHASASLAADPVAACPAGAQPAPALPHTAAALAANQPVVIVAIGSSSTQGVLASDVAHAYPSILQHRLNQEFPSAEFSVINRGIGGQDAAEELARLDTDVVVLKPALVIWQVGANGALRAVDPAVFARLVSSGIGKLKAAGADVILMDNQRTARVVAAIENNRIDQVLASVASEQQVGLFARSALMEGWAKEGRQMVDFTASDGLHMNDLGYRCVAEALADALARGLRSKPQ